MLLQVKGYEDNQAHAEHDAAEQRGARVKHRGQVGPSAFHVCRNPQLLGRDLAFMLGGGKTGERQ